MAPAKGTDEVVNFAGDDVVGIDAGAVEEEDGGHFAAVLGALGGEGGVGDDFAEVHVEAPGFEQFGKGGLAGAFAEDLGHLIVLLVEVGVGIDEGEELAAAEDELVEGVLGGVGDVAGLDDDEHFDVVIDGGGGEGNFFDGEILFQFADEGPGFLGLLAHLTHHHGIHLGAEEREGAHDADGGAGGIHDAGDGAGDVVFEEALAVGAEPGQGDLFIEHA